jgi:AcrR family transcriptional regulator
LGIAERREREREIVRTSIVEAARDILSEQGVDALSMRGIAERIEYSPATIYLYFKDKDELVREVVVSGFERLREYMLSEIGKVASAADARAQYAATGRAYARFALDNTAYFKVMFELPAVAQMECPEPRPSDAEGPSLAEVLDDVQRRAGEAGMFDGADDPGCGPIFGWALIHGLVSLYLTGRLSEHVQTSEQFMGLIEQGMQMLGRSSVGTVRLSTDV